MTTGCTNSAGDEPYDPRSVRTVGASAWGALLAYAALSAANQMLWLTYAPITTGAAHHYGVSTASIG